MWGDDDGIDAAVIQPQKGNQMKRIDTLKPWLVFRSAIDGRFVSRAYALLHPETTVSERRIAGEPHG